MGLYRKSAKNKNVLTEVALPADFVEELLMFMKIKGWNFDVQTFIRDAIKNYLEELKKKGDV